MQPPPIQKPAATVRLAPLLVLSTALLATALACRAASVVSAPASPTPTLFIPTFTPAPSATPAPPTPTPSATPPPSLQAAEQAAFAGDWSRAIAGYQAVLAQGDDPAPRAAAHLGLARTRLESGDSAGALDELRLFRQQFPDAPQMADASFLEGEAHYALGNLAEAISAYQAYQQARPGIIDSYVFQRIGQAAYAQQDFAAALSAFQAAASAPRADAGETLDLRQQAALAHLALGQTEAALAEYEAVYQQTDQNWRRARMDILAGQLLYQLERHDEAHTKFLDAVNNYPEAGDTFQGLVALVEAGVPVDELQRGLVNYYAENYAPAAAAFDRYLAEDSPPNPAAALYYKALALEAQDQPAEAIAVLRQLLAAHPDDPNWGKAYLRIAFIQPYPADVETFVALADEAPEAVEAPDALYRAARLCERNGDLRRAAELWTRLANDYPTSTQAADSAVQAGVVLFRAGDFGAAALRFEASRALAPDADQQARAWLWLGKAQERLGNAAAARAAWTRAAALGPHGYYALRAAQLLQGRSPFAPPAGYRLDFNAAAEQAEAEVWLRAAFPALAETAALSELQPGLFQEARFRRGSELWRLGRLREAHREFDSLRRDMQGDPLAMWQLALYFNRLGAYDLSIRSARAVVDLAGYADTLLAPRFILRLRYPAPFAALVQPAAAEYGLHPFLMYAKMRLESFFWKYAISSAEARGLNQIIPPTADDIARRLGLAGFSYDDLYRPAVSISMGAFYLSLVGSHVEDDPAAMLAGYYAGPGNAGAWQDLAGGDPDLFVEVIRLPDARGYVTTAFEYFETYRTLYGTD